MPANQAPIFPLVGNITANGTTGMGQPILLAANDFTGAGANNVLVFTAGANGSLVQRLHFKAVGTNVQTVARIFINNGSTNATATNNSFYDDQVLPATTASANNQSGSALDYSFGGNGLMLAPGFKVYIGFGTAVAAGWVCIPIAMDF